MAKRLGLPIVVLVVLALAVPAAASASPIIWNKSFGTVKTGTALKATGISVAFTSSTLGTISCEKMTLPLSVLVNNTTSGFELTGTSSFPETSGCKNGANPVTVLTFSAERWASTLGGEAGLTFTATFQIGKELLCRFTGLSIRSTYTNGGKTLTFSNASFVTSSPAACGSVKLDGSFVLETSIGEEVFFVY